MQGCQELNTAIKDSFRDGESAKNKYDLNCRIIAATQRRRTTAALIFNIYSLILAVSVAVCNGDLLLGVVQQTFHMTVDVETNKQTGESTVIFKAADALCILL